MATYYYNKWLIRISTLKLLVGNLCKYTSFRINLDESSILGKFTFTPAFSTFKGSSFYYIEIFEYFSVSYKPIFISGIAKNFFACFVQTIVDTPTPAKPHFLRNRGNCWKRQRCEQLFLYFIISGISEQRKHI